MSRLQVEVFKTNVENDVSALEIIGTLERHFPGFRINFDLQDCDRILRIQGPNICIRTIREIVKWNGFDCELLED